TPQGEQAVGPGDFCFFPESPSGAHKRCNASATDTLVYIDFGAGDELDVAKYSKFVLSAVDKDFGEEINSRFALAVWLDAPRDVRMERIRHRAFFMSQLGCICLTFIDRYCDKR
ncbi:MAG: hypothetical protein LBM60_07755, partial [Clostridium sp.]|nr:hypothetical protein [Clostridium sp.]